MRGQTMTYGREVTHKKMIADGKLYNTETAEYITWFIDKNEESRLLFQTKNGNYFSVKTTVEQYKRNGDSVQYVYNEIYCDLRPETDERAKELIGLYNVDKYIELFGEVEEA